MGFCLFVLFGGAPLALAEENPSPNPPGNPNPHRGEIRAACKADVQKLCAGVEPGGGRIIQCLAQHKEEVSAECKAAVAKARQGAS